MTLSQEDPYEQKRTLLYFQTIELYYEEQETDDCQLLATYGILCPRITQKPLMILSLLDMMAIFAVVLICCLFGLRTYLIMTTRRESHDTSI